MKKFKLSSLQQGMYDQIMVQGDNIDNIVCKISFNGHKTKENLIDVIMSILSESPICLGRIAQDNGSVVQIIDNLPEELCEYQHFATEISAYKYGLLLQQKGLNISKALCHFTVYNTDENTYGIIMSISHLITDGWSIKVTAECFYKRLNAEEYRLYNFIDETLKTNEKSEKKEAVDIEYWCNQLKNREGRYLDTQNIATHESESIKKHIGKEFADMLVSFCDKTKCSRPQLMHTAVGILLKKLTPEQSGDTFVEFELRGRKGQREKNALGLYLKVLPLLVDTDDESTVLECLKSTQTRAFNAYRHASCSYVDVLTHIRNDKIDARPHTDISFNYLIEGAKDNYYNSIHWYAAKKQEKSLEIEVTEWGDAGSFDITYHYDTSVLTEKLTELIHERFIRLLTIMVNEPNTKIIDVDIIPDAEKNFLINKINDTASEYDKEKTISELFNGIVEKFGDKIAVYSDKGSITYKNLNRKVNILAKYLRSKGLRRGDRVCLFTDKSIEMVIAILAVIKAGGAYIPVDPDYPMERKSYIIKDSSPSMIIRYADAECIPENAHAKVVDLSDECIWKNEAADIENINDAEDICYIIYTSGTTGNPKGVLIRHKSLNNLVKSYQKIYEITENDVILQSAQYVFDQSVQDIFLALLSGASIALITRDELLNPTWVKAYINNLKVTVIGMTPLAIAELDPTDYPQIRLLESGGGEANPEVLKKWLKKGRKIFNTYGPTENTVNTTSYEYKGKENGIIPIGKVIPNNRIYVMWQNKICGVGIPGELCISGDSLSVGYLNNKELTDKAFVQNPFEDGIMYLTGDIVRLLEDGNIEYLGRKDDQVKIRGFRIELGEIDIAIRKTGLVSNCAVIAKKDPMGDDAIYAYLVSDDSISLNELKAELQKTLPYYMIPGYMLQIDKIPVTVNGKLDKKSLPDITKSCYTDYEAPHNDVQKMLCEIFSVVLECEKIGINDNFFELGGHSLRAVHLINLIENELSIRLPVNVIFTYPTPLMLSNYIDKNKDFAVSKEDEHIPKADKKDKYPMSSSQKRMHLVWLTDKNTMAYNMSVTYHIEGNADPNRIEKALKSLVEKRSSFRTELFMEKDEFYQRIVDNVSFSMERSNTDEGFFRPFDLGKAPLIRARYVDDKADPKLLIDIHHSISDGASVTLFMRDFAKAYETGDAQQERLDFTDYTVWMAHRDISKQEAFWLNMFSDDVPVLNLPYDYQRPALHSANGSSVFRKIPKKIIRDFAKQHTMTDYMVFITVAMILMEKYSREEDIVIGSPMNARTNSDAESIYGMFVNTLALRGYPSVTKTVNEFASEIKKLCIDTYENQEYPFDELVDHVAIERDMSRNALFDVMLVLQNNENAFDSPEDEIHMGEVILRREHAKRAGAKFDLTFEIMEEADEYELELEYCTDLFKESTAHSILEHMELLIKNMNAHPDTVIGEIDIVSDAEKKSILEAFQGEIDTSHSAETIVSLLDKNIQKTPDNIAVSYGDKKLSYKELGENIDIASRYLIAQKVSSNHTVAIVGERCFNMIIYVYAALKIGASYVMVDNLLPEGRKEEIINNSKAKIILKAFAADTLPKDNLKICKKAIDKDNAQFVKPTPDSNAYIIYTSGTTGKPKGIMLKHRGVVNLINWLKKNHPIGYNGKLLEKTNLTFVDSVYEMFWALSEGAQLCILPQGEEVYIDSIADMISRERITNIILVPTVLNELIKNEKYDLSSLRTVMISGETLKKSVIEKAQIKLSDECCLINQYGQSEGGFTSTHYEMYMDGSALKDTGDLSVLPIGKPIDNVNYYVMDHDKLCAVGIPGEICITSAGLSDGYINAENREINNIRYNKLVDKKICHTGDIGRWLPDGNLIVTGRIDDQLKIRGQRIEPGEIEAVIKNTGLVQDCVVLATFINDTDTDKSILAYIVPEKQYSDDITGKIKEAIAHKLPRYMMPSAIIKIDCIPRTVNGKLNKRLLPKPVPEKRTYEAPNTDTEKVLCKSFSEVLEVENVGVTDNFFMIGGHSLKAAYLCNLLKEDLNVEVTIKDIFDHSTPGELGKYIDTLPKGTVKYESIPKAKKAEYYEMTSQQKRTYIANMKNPLSLAYNMSFTFEIKGKIDVKKLEKCFVKLIENHSSFRLGFSVHNGVLSQKLYDSVPFKMQIMDKYDKTFHKPFDLKTPPLIRAAYVENYRTSEEDNCSSAMLFDIHHIICDGASTPIILQELQKLYNEDEVEPEKVSYIDYAQWFKSRDLSKQRDYWLKMYEEDPPVLDIPTQTMRTGARSSNGNTITGYVNKTLVQQFGRDKGITDYMLLLSAYMIVLGKYSNADDVVVGTPVNGRSHKDIENIPGIFINELALRGHPKGDMSIEDFIAEIKEMCLSAFENQDYPFDLLVEELGISYDISRSPLFDVEMILQNNKAEFGNNAKVLTMGDAVIMPAVSNRSGAKLDMILEIVDDDDEYRLNFEYNTDLYSLNSAKRFLELFSETIECITKNPKKKICDLPAATKKDIESIKAICLNSKSSYKNPGDIISAIRKVKERNPNAPAIWDNGDIISYDQLLSRAEMLAKGMISNGIKQGDVIAVAGKRSAIKIIDVLGVWMLGGINVLLDNSYPEERVKKIIAESKAKGILYADTLILDPFGSNKCEKKIANDEYDFEIKVKLDGDSPAYIHYTSGTDGNPKGIQIPHRGPLLRVKSADKYLCNVTESIRCVHAANYTYVLSMEEIYRPLLQGGCMYIVPDGKEKDCKYLVDFVYEHKINFIHIVPTLVDLVLEQANNSNESYKLESLECVETGGEQLKVHTVQKFISMFGDRKLLVQNYGQTESATIIITNYPIQMEDISRSSIPIGKPEAYVDVYIVQGNSICGIGVPGEICAGGGALSFGYLDKKLNESKYTSINIPGENEKRKVLKTGDLGRWLEDGNIVHMGRRDHQVKLHGQRLELGEVINAVNSCSGVKDNVVVTDKSGTGETILCAYIIPDNPELSVAELKRQLSEKIPAYMIPSTFNFIKEIPLTSNGKLNKKLLPKPVFNYSITYLEPRNDVERKICECFKIITGTEKVGIKDSFFNIGGDSISCIKLVALLESEEYLGDNANINVSDIFSLQTPEKLADKFNEEVPLCVCQTVYCDTQENYDKKYKEIMLMERQAKGITPEYADPTESNKIFLINPWNHVVLRWKISKDIALPDALKAFSKVIYGTGFESAFNAETMKYVRYKGSRRNIKVLDITKAEANSLILDLASQNQEYDGKTLLSDIFAISPKEDDNYLYLSVQHSVTDRMCRAIITENWNRLLRGQECLENKTETIPSDVEEKNHETPDSFWYYGKALQEKIRDREFTRSVVTKKLLYDGITDPIRDIIEMFLKNNPIFDDMDVIPLIVVDNGRNAGNLHKIDCCIKYLFKLYDKKKAEFIPIKGIILKPSMDQALWGIPLINYIGIFEDERTKEDVYTIRKGFEKARYLHGSIYEDELVLKMPIYDWNQINKKFE